MIGLERQKEMFKLIGTLCKRKVECIAIGGSAMLFYGMKQSTKDVDIIFLSEDDRSIFSSAIKKIGFMPAGRAETKPGRPPIVYEGMDTRFDLFANGVFHFRLSPGIKERVREKHEFGNLLLDVISPNDIVLLKSVTDRMGDRVDVSEIIKNFNIEWDVVIKECTWQTGHGEKAFSVFLFDFLEELRDELGADIPKGIIKRVRKMAEEEMLKALKGKRSDIKQL